MPVPVIVRTPAPSGVGVIYSAHLTRIMPLPVPLMPVSAGFPSPADDYIEGKLDLNQHLIQHPAATFFVRVTGDSMIDAGLHSGDLLVVDRAIIAAENSIVIAVIDGELTVKRLRRQGEKLFLIAENRNYPPIEVHQQTSFEVWGVVTSVIHPV